MKGGGEMKKIYSKIPAMIGMLVTMIGVVLLIDGFIISNNEVFKCTDNEIINNIRIM